MPSAMPEMPHNMAGMANLAMQTAEGSKRVAGQMAWHDQGWCTALSPAWHDGWPALVQAEEWLEEDPHL